MSAERRRASYKAWLPALRVPVVAAATLLGLLVFAILADGVLTGDRIHHGITVAGIDLGGLSRSEAARSLERRLRPVLDGPVAFRHRSLKWPLDRSSLSFQLGYRASAETAWRETRKGSLLTLPGSRLSLWFRPRAVPVEARFDRDAFDRLMKRIAGSVESPPVDAGLRIVGTRIVTRKQQTGLAIDRRAAERDMIDAFASATNREREIATRIVPVSIGDESISEPRAKAKEMMSRPLYLRYKRRTWQVSRAQIGSWIVFKRRLATWSGGTGTTLEAVLDKRRVRRSIERLTVETLIRPRDAVFKPEGESMRILPSRIGAGIDTDRAYARILKVTSSSEYRLVPLVMRSIKPRVTTEWAKSTGIRKRLATYTTTFDSGAASRVKNIHLLAAQLNNTFVKPGGVFSFNKTIGPRTAEKGYQEAPAIIGGELVPSIGGGVCQVATTIFNSVFFAGLDVVERHNHSFYISHYPDGRDATVSWDGPDFKFRNDTPNWLLIKVQWGDGFITISIFGGSIENNVTFEASDFRNYSEPPMKQIADAGLAVGRKVVEDRGIRGRDITVWRTVTRGGKVIHQDTFESHYEPKAGTERVGTKPAPKPARPSKESTKAASR